MSWFSRITAGLTKSAANVTEGIKQAIGLAAKLDDATLEALEEALIAADTSLPVAQAILKDLQKAKLPDPLTQEALKQVLADLIAARLQPLGKPLDFTASPTVILVAGVNGAGKTTTIGKLAAQWAAEGKDVVVAAADTFRAAAVEQLRVWTDRADASTRKGKVGIVPPAKEGADSASVAYAALEKAKAEKADIVLIDTAGRLANRQDLLAELPKLNRVIQKLDASAPHHTLLVLDATLGQSTLPQVAEFHKQIPLTGLIVTKLDGTAKAGFLLALAAQPNPLPVVAIGVGESLDDLGPFDPQAFAAALVGNAG
ncbi:MAG: signal recognition particle-docking protein FtsY [Blastochloris viridis]|uniref:Signal recognition particle-docking protein FtsY n=1 Tax=Blastochloris viridis TaxID=1079 RepID=A0A6N4RFD0_BLAVI|nr:MAG: signal recognition particle-docking protein FtsY [Blastochloris viridis]